MAQWLHAWELGGERGHLARMVTLARALAARGESVRLAVPASHLDAARRHWPDVVPAPARTSPPSVRAPASFAEILQNEGWTRPAALRHWIDAWREVFDARPGQRLLLDFAPNAALAAFALGRPATLVGTGFYLPPDRAPMPAFRDDASAYAERPARIEALLADALADVLGARAPERPAGVFHHPGLAAVLATEPGFDHYPDRPAGRYVGVFSHAPDACTEPPAPGLFAYPKPFPGLPALLDALLRPGLPLTVHGDGRVAEVVAQLRHPALHHAPRPVAEEVLAGHALAVVNHGGHDGSFKAVRAGVPVLALPLHPEQRCVARSLGRLGAGCDIGASPRALGEALARLAAGDRGMADAAAAAAAGWATPARALQAVLGALEERGR